MHSTKVLWMLSIPTTDHGFSTCLWVLFFLAHDGEYGLDQVGSLGVVE